MIDALEGLIDLTPLPGERTRITLKPHDPQTFVALQSCDTALPLDIIELLANKTPFAWVCEFITRHDDYVADILRKQLFAYFSPSDFDGKRVLDFGCGSGASTLAMAAMLPGASITGVELDPGNVELANQIAQRKDAKNVRFLVSPSGDCLPPQIGQFDFIVLSAVYEHLLPAERRTVMPLLWEALKPGGVLFINQTPHRYVPLEHHSTGLWFINYLPDKAAHWVARHFARYKTESNRSPDWAVHLRAGLRGGTERGMIADVTCKGGPKATILQPCQNGLKDRADYWLHCTSPRHRLFKRGVAFGFRICDKLFDTIPALNVDVALRKQH